jgi:hypothetical protein
MPAEAAQDHWRGKAMHVVWWFMFLISRDWNRFFFGRSMFHQLFSTTKLDSSAPISSKQAVRKPLNAIWKLLFLFIGAGTGKGRCLGQRWLLRPLPCGEGEAGCWQDEQHHCYVHTINLFWDEIKFIVIDNRIVLQGQRSLSGM